MAYKMAEELVRLLTEDLLDEEWHETVESKDIPYHGILRKCNCGLVECQKENRTFLIPADQKAVMRKLVEKGLWDEFTEYSQNKYLAEINIDCICDCCDSFWSWLFLEEERFCYLAAQFMEERRRKG